MTVTLAQTKKSKIDFKPRFEIASIADKITFQGLKVELDRRKISRDLANGYLKQGNIRDCVTKKIHHGFLFENDQFGYEVSIPNPSKNRCFQTCIGSKASTRILLDDDMTESADVFECFWDYLAWLEINGEKLPRNHSYILNSTSLVNETCEKVLGFQDIVKNVFLFMGNYEAGYQRTHAIAEKLVEGNFNIGSREQIYNGYKNLSEFRMK